MLRRNDSPVVLLLGPMLILTAVEAAAQRPDPRLFSTVTAQDRLEAEAESIELYFEDRSAVRAARAEGGLVAHSSDIRLEVLELGEATVWIGDDRVGSVSLPASLLPSPYWVARQASALSSQIETDRTRFQDLDLRWVGRSLSFGHKNASAEVRPRSEVEAIGSYPGLLIVVRRDSAGATGKEANGTYPVTLTAELYSDLNQRLGVVRWFSGASVLSWSIAPLGQQGWLDEERSPGGFPIEPSVRWMVTQAYAFWKGGLQLAERAALRPTPGSSSGPRVNGEDTPSRSLPTLGRHPTRLALRACERVADGCTGFHYWGDDTVIVNCCNEHDNCYYNRETCCRFWSWLPFVGRAECNQCNRATAECFRAYLGTSCYDFNEDGQVDSVTECGCRERDGVLGISQDECIGQGTPDPDYPNEGPGCGGGYGHECDSDPCTVSGAQWCPAECFECTRL